MTKSDKIFSGKQLCQFLVKDLWCQFDMAICLRRFFIISTTTTTTTTIIIIVIVVAVIVVVIIILIIIIIIINSVTLTATVTLTTTRTNYNDWLPSEYHHHHHLNGQDYYYNDCDNQHWLTTEVLPRPWSTDTISSSTVTITFIHNFLVRI